LIFVDTSFWVAVMVARDNHYVEATELFTRFPAERLVTTNHVRGETWTFLNRRHGHSVALNFLDRLDRTRHVEVRFLGEELERESLRWLRRHDEREYSFVDATSFALMRSLRIRRALAFDGDFAAAGFTELRGGS
jgi:uncharacterized protein